MFPTLLDILSKDRDSFDAGYYVYTRQSEPGKFKLSDPAYLGVDLLDDNFVIFSTCNELFTRRSFSLANNEKARDWAIKMVDEANNRASNND